MHQLLTHQRKEKLRSPFWTKNILLNILLGFVGFWLFIMALSAGLAAIRIIAEFYSDLDATEVFTGLLFYFFVFDLISRFLIQKLPAMSIQPYRTLPVSRMKLLHYPLIRSVFSFFNLLPFFLIMPFFIMVVCAGKPAFFSLAWIITLVCFIGVNNFLNFSIKKYFIKKPVLILLLFFITGTLLFLDLQEIFQFSPWFAKFTMYIAGNPPLVILPVSMVILAYRLAYSTMKKNYYPEEAPGSRTITGGFSFLSRYGETGELLGIELKMILRNKRPRSVMIFSLIFLGYGLLLYDDLDNIIKLLMGGFLLTFAFALNYGQFLFSWEGTYFDSYLANKISAYHYIRSKYLFFAAAGIIGFLLTLPYILISPKIFFVNLSMLLYNAGVSSILLLFLCTNNSTSIDLGKSQFMNYQGTGAIQFLMIIPLIGIPIGIHIIFLILGIRHYTIPGLGILGLIGIIFSRYLLQMVVNLFLSRKYTMASGFRKIN